MTYGARDIVRNPSILRVDPNESLIIEDKKAHKTLGVYLGIELAKDFFAYQKKKKLLDAARSIKANSLEESKSLEGSLDDGL